MGLTSPRRTWIDQPLGRWAGLALVALVLVAPAWLMADPLACYRLASDDFSYIAASRTWERTASNLFLPHNTHIVPSWRLVTWGVSVAAGSLAGLPRVLGPLAFGILVAAILLTGRLVARETGRAAIGLGAMALLGTTSVMESAATWYSAGQTLWAGSGVLATLTFLQGWRRDGGRWRLVAAMIAVAVAGGFWTIGHAAGPVGAVYLWADGRRHCRRAAIVPLAATFVTLAVFFALGGRNLGGSLVSVHGRTVKEAIEPVQGFRHTLQAIPENLIAANLGITTETTPDQGAVLTLILGLVWLTSLVRNGRRPNPLECAGIALVFISYYVEWTFRGYLPFSSLRGPVVPWYDTIPHIGAVLFASGWWSGRGMLPTARPTPATRGQGLAIIGLVVVLVLLHGPRVESQFKGTVPPMNEVEAKFYLIPELQRLRAIALAGLRKDWQRRHLARLDQAEALARRLGIGREAIREAFGRVVTPEIPKVYDAADMLDLPWRGSERNPEAARRALAPLFTMEPAPELPDARTIRGL